MVLSSVSFMSDKLPVQLTHNEVPRRSSVVDVDFVMPPVRVKLRAGKKSHFHQVMLSKVK